MAHGRGSRPNGRGYTYIMLNIYGVIYVCVQTAMQHQVYTYVWFRKWYNDIVYTV